jgi:hypothetical protein
MLMGPMGSYWDDQPATHGIHHGSQRLPGLVYKKAMEITMLLMGKSTISSHVQTVANCKRHYQITIFNG